MYFNCNDTQELQNELSKGNDCGITIFRAALYFYFDLKN